MKPINDQYQRKRALDPTHSFIVQAPAGSGKTELLTQRFLTLLSCVNHPEDILAITFTKKSSAEMRDRIITALDEAMQNHPTESPHKQLTRELALNALKQNQTQGWNLIENPNRLRIQTIDSFNYWLARQLPTLSRFGSAPDIADDPYFLYREAVQEFLLHLEENTEWSNAIETLLLHMDNDLNKVEELLITLLKKRDQWLPLITSNADDPLLREILESNLAAILTDTLENLDNLFPKQERDELAALASIAASHLTDENSASCIVDCKNLSKFPTPHIDNKPIWQGLAKLLLTDELEWRKRFDKKIGFPAASNAIHPETKIYLKELQQRIKLLIEKLNAQEELRQAFVALHHAPEHVYQDNQWSILSALYQTLKIVVAQLKLVFQRYGKIDYIENSEAALAALGQEDQPTDLALALDFKLQHILVDEFQDTSNNQFRLLEKLTAGWEKDDGHTLFLVGDPMQSIYRFREAEVGLFIRARKKGIHAIHLEPLSLTVNFRSVPDVVNWVNDHFQFVLPNYDDIASGAISFSPSIANKGQDSIPAITLHPLQDPLEPDQANAIVDVIKTTKLQHPDNTIAILVRSRTHLKQIMPILRKQGLAYRAIDIDPLTTRPLIQDLLALTKAFLHPANRIAWLSILRAPWCGLTLNDLLILAQNAKQQTLFERLKDSSVISQLSQNAQQRLARVLPILEQKISDRRRMPLCEWVESSWHLLGGPACINELSDLDDAATFFKLLEKLEEGADLINVDHLDEAIEKLYAAPDITADASLQIMTIHNAKGLEFDTVILPHLESRAPYDKKQLLLWMERPRLDAASHLIIAPVHAIGQEQDSIYEYIKHQHTIKSDFETGRLLYVAATRAKKQLHLFFSLESKNNGELIAPSTNSLLNKLWPAIKNKIPEPIKNSSNHHSSPTFTAKKIKRLTDSWKNSLLAPLKPTAMHQKIPGFKLDNDDPKYTGILVHKILENMTRHGTTWWESRGTSNQLLYIKQQLLQLGMLPHAIAASSTLIANAITNTLNDSRGQWILQSHQDSQTELSLTAIIDLQPKELIIDRTFVDNNGTRWIIDYKSSSPDSTSLEEFLANEQKKYEPQMQQYYIAMRELDNRPIRLGLYFPMISAWHEWAIDG